MPSAEYMREYRKRRKAAEEVEMTSEDVIAALRLENARLTEDAARLKREVAELRGELISRLIGPTNVTMPDQTRTSSAAFQTFRPAPKPGRK